MRPRDLLESDCLLHNPLTETKMREACEIGVSKRSFRIIHVLSGKMFFFFFFFFFSVQRSIKRGHSKQCATSSNVNEQCARPVSTMFAQSLKNVRPVIHQIRDGLV